MGSRMSKKRNNVHGEKIVFRGPLRAGKTTILYRLKKGEVLPETSYLYDTNVELVDLGGGQEVPLWDLGGRHKVRALDRLSMVQTTGLVFVLDSSDREGLEEALDSVFWDLTEWPETRDLVCMVLANKQDVDGSMTGQEVEHALKEKVAKLAGCSQTLFVRAVSATADDGREGLQEAFHCLKELIPLKRSGHLPRGVISVKRVKDESTTEKETTNPKTTLDNAEKEKTSAGQPEKKTTMTPVEEDNETKEDTETNVTTDTAGKDEASGEEVPMKTSASRKSDKCIIPQAPWEKDNGPLIYSALQIKDLSETKNKPNVKNMFKNSMKSLKCLLTY